MPQVAHNLAEKVRNLAAPLIRVHPQVVSRHGALHQTADKARKIITTIHCHMEARTGIKLHLQDNMPRHYPHIINLIPYNQEICISIIQQTDKPLDLITNQFVDRITPAAPIRGELFNLFK